MFVLKVVLTAAIGWGVLSVLWFVFLAVYAAGLLLRWAVGQLFPQT